MIFFSSIRWINPLRSVRTIIRIRGYRFRSCRRDDEKGKRECSVKRTRFDEAESTRTNSLQKDSNCERSTRSGTAFHRRRSRGNARTYRLTSCFQSISYVMREKDPRHQLQDEFPSSGTGPFASLPRLKVYEPGKFLIVAPPTSRTARLVLEISRNCISSVTSSLVLVLPLILKR